jgi:hypothetical protein
LLRTFGYSQAVGVAVATAMQRGCYLPTAVLGIAATYRWVVAPNTSLVRD